MQHNRKGRGGEIKRQLFKTLLNHWVLRPMTLTVYLNKAVDFLKMLMSASLYLFFSVYTVASFCNMSYLTLPKTTIGCKSFSLPLKCISLGVEKAA